MLKLTTTDSGQHGSLNTRSKRNLEMVRGCCQSSGRHASIELLPQPSLPVLLDGFAGPISDGDSGERQVYVTWSQVQCFLRMAEEALRAKNLAHDKLIGEMQSTRSELEEKHAVVYTQMMKEGDALTEDSAFLKQQMASLLAERQVLRERIAALERENKFLRQERDLLEGQLDWEEVGADECRHLMHTPLTLAKIEELRLTRSTSEVEQHAARLALAACLKGALQGALVSTPGTVTRPDAAAGAPQRAYGDENASPLPNQDFPQPHWPKCAAFPSSCYAPEKEFCSGWGPVVGQPGQGRCADDNDRVHGDVNDGVRDGDDGSSDSSAESQSTAWAEAFEHPECLDVLRGLSPVDLSPLRFAHATRDDPTFLAGAATGSPGCSSASSCDVAGDLGMPLVRDASPVKYPSGRHPAERPPAEFVAEDCSADRALPGGVACHPLHPQPELQKKGAQAAVLGQLSGFSSRQPRDGR